MIWNTEPLEHPQRVVLELTEGEWKAEGALLTGVLDRRARVQEPPKAEWSCWLMTLDFPIWEEGRVVGTLALWERHVGSTIRPDKLREVAVNVNTVLEPETSGELQMTFVAIGLLRRLKKAARLSFAFPDR